MLPSWLDLSGQDPLEPEHVPDAPPDAAQRRALAWLAGAGALLVIAGLAMRGGDSLLVLFGFVLLAHAAVVLASWLPPGQLTGRVDDFLDRWVESVAGGWYGLVALAAFAQLEAAALVDDLADFSLTRTALVDVVLPWMIGFSIESMWNMLRAGFWPLVLMKDHGSVWALVFAAASWVTFYAGSRVFPTERLLPVKPKAGKDAPEGSEEGGQGPRADATRSNPDRCVPAPPQPPSAPR